MLTGPLPYAVFITARDVMRRDRVLLPSVSGRRVIERGVRATARCNRGIGRWARWRRRMWAGAGEMRWRDGAAAGAISPERRGEMVGRLVGRLGRRGVLPGLGVGSGMLRVNAG